MVTWARRPYIDPMRILLLPLLAGLVFAPLQLVQAADPLQTLLGKTRPLLLFSKSRSDARLDQQEDLLRGFRPELRERDVVVLRTAGNDETQSVIGYTSINRGASRDLLARFSPAANGITVVLIGKDGTEKMRWNRLVQPRELFEIIDAMPMRRDEMEERAVN